MASSRTLFPIFIGVFLFLHSSGAEEVKITRILDANLFQLPDGKKITLANVKTPSLRDSLPERAQIAREAYHYAEQQFLGRWVRIVYADSVSADRSVRPVFLFQKFTLNSVFYNQQYLERGFGTFQEEFASSYNERLLLAERKAREKNRGLWAFPKLPTIYGLRLYFGRVQPDQQDEPYNELFFDYSPLGARTGMGFRGSAGVYQTPRENSDEMVQARFLFLNPYYAFNGKYFGIEPGMLFMYNSEEESFDYILLPILRINLGWMEKIFLDANIFNFIYYNRRGIGLTFLAWQPYLKIRGAYSDFNNEIQQLSVQGEFILWKSLMVAFQGMQFTHRETGKKSFGWRLGFGWVLP